MKKYNAPELELINMISTDVITASGDSTPLALGDPTAEMGLDFGAFGLN